MAGVEEDVIGAGFPHAREDRPGDHIARREVGEFVLALHEAHAPSRSTRNAPSPRTASEMSGCCPVDPSPSHRTVGWNWMNSRSVIRAPARSAAAIPSPVETGGFVVEV